MHTANDALPQRVAAEAEGYAARNRRASERGGAYAALRVKGVEVKSIDGPRWLPPEAGRERVE